MPDPETRSILFVCMGNICRSPTGEAVFRKLVEERGLADRVHVDSAGTIDYHAGSPPDERMTRAAWQRGIQLGGSARGIRAEDLERFDLVIAMDRENLRDIRRLSREEVPHVRLLGEFLPAGSPEDVPDPYYGGEAGFHVVLDLIERAAPAILDELLES